MKIQSAEDLESIHAEYSKRLYYPDGLKVNVGMASCGIAAGAQDSFAAAKEAFAGGPDVLVGQTGCIGFCEEEPLVEIFANGKPRMLYRKIDERKIREAIEGYMAGEFNRKWILGQMRDPRSILEEDTGNPLQDVGPSDDIAHLDDLPFYSKQVKIALRNCGYIDPDSIEEYIARRGYQAFLQSLYRMDPEEILTLVSESGLRGRGGGGSPREPSGPLAPNMKNRAT